MKRMKVTITVCSIALAGMAFSANASAECSRKSLEKVSDAYIKAQEAGDAKKLPLAAGASYAENDKTLDVGSGVLASPLKVDFTRSFYDTTQCIAFTELVAATDPHPHVILTRMETNKKGKVSKVESVVTHEGDWMFGATQYLGFTQGEHWDEIPKDKRDTRDGHSGGGRRVPGQLGKPRHCRCRMARPAHGSRGGSTPAPRTRTVTTATWASFRRRSTRTIAATSSMRTTARSSSSTTSPGSMPDWPPTARAPRAARCSG